ncbi:unnamed protein product, partial [marine sediment metagenome]
MVCNNKYIQKKKEKTKSNNCLPGDKMNDKP